MWAACHLSTDNVTAALYRSTLRLRRAAFSLGRLWVVPSFAGLHELSTPGVHSTDIAAGLVSSCLTFSPLPISTFQLSDVSTFQTGGCFLLHLQTLADLFPLGSGMPCVARTFLSPVPFPPEAETRQRQAGSLNVFPVSTDHVPCHSSLQRYEKKTDTQRKNTFFHRSTTKKPQKSHLRIRFC